MALKKDKQKVLGETFDDARIKTFLDIQAPEGVNADFNLLEKAYRGMKADNYGTFLDFFIAAGKDINATNNDGKTMLALCKEHDLLGSEYVELLTARGAK